MSFEFESTEIVSQGVQRIAHAQLAHILADLSGPRRIARDKAVHESRKRLKRLRALLRLLHGSIPRKLRHLENITFRDAARSLSAARDAKVLVDAFDELLQHAHDPLPPKAFAPIRAKLVARRRAAVRDQQRQGLTAIVRSLRAADRRLSALTFKHDDFRALSDGLKRVFHKGRVAYHKAFVDRDPDKLHDWRKRVKDLWHHTELLEPIAPHTLGPFADQSHALADCLGEDHDLAVLHHLLTTEANSFSQRADLPALLSRIDARRRELQQAAMQLGARIYAEKPAAFTLRIKNYWTAWRAAEYRETKDD